MIINFPKRKDPVQEIIRHYHEDRIAEDLLIARTSRVASILLIAAGVICLAYGAILLHARGLL